MIDRCQLLASVRVLDMGGTVTDGIGRLLADLGADVLKVEPPGGSTDRTATPTVAGVGIAFALDNANKRATVLDPVLDRERLTALAAGADIVIDDGREGLMAAFGTSAEGLAEQFPQLVALGVTDFGSLGPHAGWQATDAVLYAMSTALSRSGPTDGPPVLPPHGLASATVAAQAAWVALVAYYQRLRTGRGEYVDFSRFEAVLQSLDPPFGSEGQAAAGRKRSEELWRGRPRNQQIYPTFTCHDGFVRLCLLSARQWRGMRAWLGEPEEFADPKFESILARYVASAELNAAIGALFAGQTREYLVEEGQRRGVPIAAVLSPAEALGSEHFRVVGALTETTVAESISLTVPTGPFQVDGRHAGLRRPSPDVGADDPGWLGPPRSTGAGVGEASVRPFEELRVLDLGVIVAGGELGRLFADLGADVVKVESASYPDGLRQTRPGQAMSRSWALTHRNERSLGLDLREPRGAAMFAELVSTADAVFANFKPGTLAALGFSFDELRRLNAGIVLAESSAFGSTGPWSERMGYGPLVRATTGVSQLWTSDEVGDPTFYDATTVFPDHVVARITGIATLAALIHREVTKIGAHVHISQAEAAVNQLAASYVTEAARAAGADVVDDDSVHGVYPCAGDDEWCVISVRSDDDRAALAEVLGRVDLPSDGTLLRKSITAWTAVRDKAEIVEAVQGAGVPAGAMNRAVDVLADAQIVFRGLYTDMVHPLFDAPITAETHSTPFQRIADAELRPAPMAGEHSREIATELLGLDDAEIGHLIDEGVLFAFPPP